MKLKKSIEKAKEQRDQARQSTEEEAALTREIQDFVSVKAADMQDWNSPVYCDKLRR